MKCEIIDGVLVVEPTTNTERWAVDQFLDGARWNTVKDAVKATPLPCPTPPGDE